MSENTKKKGIALWDSKFPIVIPMLLGSLALYTASHQKWLGEMGYEYSHLLHQETIHDILLLSGLWVFFLRLGAEISLGEVAKAGPLVMGAILGGVFIPLGFTTGLLYVFGGGIGLAVALYASAGAMATDVPMALGSARFTEKVVSTVMVTALMILAIGDDLIGVIAMTGLFAEGIEQFKVLLVEAVVLFLLWMVGQDGVLRLRWWHKGDETDSELYFDFTVVSPVFWIVAAVLNTVYLGMNDIEPILGGCLPFIFAPNKVKHLIVEKTEALALWLLIPFALVAGGVDLADSKSWGIFTLLSLIGGFGGKIIGIFFGGWIGRSFAEEGLYHKSQFSNTSLLSMAAAGACNGTVAIIFVTVAQNKGFIPYDLGNQMKIGFLLTVPSSYLVNYLLAAFSKPLPVESKT